MKRTLLLVMSVGLVASVSAQNARLLRQVNHPTKYVKAYANEHDLDQNQQLAPVKPGSQTAKVSAIGLIDVGHSGNLLGYYAGGKSHLWADPNSGMVAHVHRSDMGTTGAGNTGFLHTSYSKDRGNTWIQDEGPAFFNNAGTGAQGTPFSVARYPQTALYNPYGNTNPDSTYICFTSAVRDNSNPGPSASDWGAHGYGVYRPAAGATPVHKTQHEIDTKAAVSRYYVIPDDYHISRNGTSWTIDVGGNQSVNETYQDTIYLDKGVWNPVSHDFDVDVKKVYAPMTEIASEDGGDKILDSHIAFAPDGTTGWISVLGHDSFTFQPDSIYYPILYKTTDGGNTWTGPIRVNLKNLTGLTGANDSLGFDATANPTYRYAPGFRHDLAVDHLGRPHLTLSIGVIDYDVTDPNFAGWSTTRGAAMTTIWADDATGAAWSGKFLAWPMAYWSCYGDCDPLGTDRYIDYNRPQIGTTWDGTNMVYLWEDADTAQFGSINASYGFNMQNPDVWVAAHDLVGGGWTSNPSTSATSLAVSNVGKNVTKQTAADGVAIYANLSYYVFQPTAGAFSFEVPITISEFDISASGGDLAATTVTHKYLKSVIVGLKESAPRNEAVEMNVFPNPTNGNLNINYALNTNSSVSIELFNILGEKVALISSSTNEAPGKHMLTVDMSNFTAGVYFLRSNVNGNIATTKVTKN